MDGWTDNPNCLLPTPNSQLPTTHEKTTFFRGFYIRARLCPQKLVDGDNTWHHVDKSCPVSLWLMDIVEDFSQVA